MQLDFVQALNNRVRSVAALLGARAEENGLPVVRADGVCTVEVGVDDIAVLTKMSRETALKYDFSRLDGREFEVYGAGNLAGDLRKAGESAEKLRERIRRSEEREICFSFAAREEELSGFVRFLREEGFTDEL